MLSEVGKGNLTHEFYALLSDLGVPLFTAPPADGDGYDRPTGWQKFTATGNDVRLAHW